MLFSNKTQIEEYVIETLDKGPIEGPALIENIQKQKSGTAKEAIYRVLRQLLKNEIINKTKTFYSLNRYWIQKVYDFGKRHLETPANLDIANVLDFEDGDKVTYQFKNPYLMDIYWGHLYDLVYDAHSPKIPLLNFYPHQWLIIARYETEKYFLDRFKKDKKMILFSIGGNTALDKKFQKEWSNNYLKINTGISYGMKSNQHLCVLGDFIFEVTVAPKFGKEVDEFFKKHTVITEEAKAYLQKLTQSRYRCKLVFMRNKKKADAWRKKYYKDFYVPNN